MSRTITCDNPECPVVGAAFVQMTSNDGSCGVCGKTPSKQEAER